MGLPPRSLAADAYDCIMVQVPDVGNLPNTRTWCAIIAPPPARFTSNRLALFRFGWLRAVPQKGPEPPAVLGPVKKWPGNAMGVLNDMRRPSLTDPARGGRESRGRDGRMSSAGGRTKG
jgi:hypothetical protein